VANVFGAPFLSRERSVGINCTLYVHLIPLLAGAVEFGLTNTLARATAQKRQPLHTPPDADALVPRHGAYSANRQRQ
jgi:hypothetical protein